MTASRETPEVALRPLEGTRDDLEALQRVLEAAPDYAGLLTGMPPGSADAQSTCSALPEGKGYDDKFVLGVYAEGSMVGCIDVIRRYPDPATVYIGLLLVIEPRQHQGLGSAALAAVEDLARGWAGCARMRLGVLRANRRAHGFWIRHGFVPTGETKPYRHGPVASEVVLYEKPLC